MESSIMKIETDAQGQDAIVQLCDIALKHSGIQNFKAVQQILSSIEVKEAPKEEDK